MTFKIASNHYKHTANRVFIKACEHVGINFSTATAFYLDAEQVRTSNALLAAGVPRDDLYVANSDSKTAAIIRRTVPKTVTSTSTEFLRTTKQTFNIVWADYCCTPSKTFDDPRLLFERGLMLPGIIAVTFCRRGISVEQQLDKWTDILYTSADLAGFDLCELVNETYKTMILIIWEVRRGMKIDFHTEAHVDSIRYRISLIIIQETMAKPSLIFISCAYSC